MGLAVLVWPLQHQGCCVIAKDRHRSHAIGNGRADAGDFPDCIKNMTYRPRGAR